MMGSVGSVEKMIKIILFFTVLLICQPIHADKIKWALENTCGRGPFHDGLASVFFRDPETGTTNFRKQGYMDRSGKIVIEPKFKSTEDFYNGMAIVETETGYGIINTNGYFILAPEYSQIYFEEKCPGVYRIKDKDGNYGLFFGDRIVISPSKDNSCGLLNFPIVEKIDIFTGEKYDMSVTVPFGIEAIREKNGKREYVFFDKEGNKVPESVYSMSSKGVKEFWANGIWGLVNTNTGDTIAIRKDMQLKRKDMYNLDYWFNDRLVKRSYDEKTDSWSYYIYNEEGKLIYETKDTLYAIYPSILSGGDMIYDYDGNKLLSGGDKFLYPIHGDWIICENKTAGNFIFNVKNNKKYGCKFAEYADGMIRLALDSGYTFVNAETGQKLTDNFERAELFNENVALVTKNNKQYVIDKNGKKVLELPDGLEFSGNYFSEGVIEIYDSFSHSYGYIYHPSGTDYVYNQNIDSSNKELIDIWFERGIGFLEKDNYRSALEWFYKIMMNDPQHSEATNNYGYCLTKLGHDEEALEAYTLAYEINPTNENAKKNMSSMKQRIMSKKQEESSNDDNGSFWNALAAFGQALSQLDPGYENYSGNGEAATESTIGNISVETPMTTGQGGCYDASFYQQEYSRWENVTRRHFNSITNLGYDDKPDNHGSASKGMSRSTYARMKKLFRDAQREMRNVRQKARKDGVNIPQSQWETKTVSY